MNEPENPLTELAQLAAMQHEMYAAWVEAGFTPDQAMVLTVAFVTELTRGAKS